MANRTAHVTFGAILAIIFIPIDIILINNNFGLLPVDTWFFYVIGFLLAIIGSEGPDFDQLYSFMSHRDIVSHSCIYPGIVFGVSMWWRITQYNIAYDPLISIFIPFMIAYASHLFLDYFPNIQVRKLTDGALRIGEKKGTFLMHVPFIYKDRKGRTRRTLNVKGTEWWLLGNAFIIMSMASLTTIAHLVF